MDNYDFFNAFVTAIGTDAAIGAWCTSYFGKEFKVFADVSGAELPQAADMPYAIMHTPGVDKHQEIRDQRYAIAVDLAIDKNALASRPETNIEQPAGIELIMDLATLVTTAVKNALPANTVFGFSLSADTLGSLPEVYAYIDFEFTTHLTLGVDPLS